MLSLILVVGSCIAASAGSVSQLPKTGPSYDFASEEKTTWMAAMADDWVCSDGAPIYGIRWWGSYWTPPVPNGFTSYSDGLNGAARGGITSFAIGICPNVLGGGTMPFDHPDLMTLLAAWEAPIADVNETYAFTVTKSTNPSVVEDIYSYSVDLTAAAPVAGLPSGPFLQQQDTKYWLVVLAEFHDFNRQWGWHEADGHWGSYAVQTVFGDGDPAWYIPCGGHDMAFEFVIPEPGALCALAVGLTGLIGLAGKRRSLKS